MISNIVKTLLFLFSFTLLLSSCKENEIPIETGSSTLQTLPLVDSTDGYALANIPNNINLPADAGPHTEYQTEWWYYTGTLHTEKNEKFGYQFTLFRYSLAPDSEVIPSESEWRTNQVYFAHIAIADIENSIFLKGERFSRDSVGLAGATSEPYHIWIEDWSVKETDGIASMIAETEDFGFNLLIEQNYDNAIYHGEGGLSIKGDSEGEASYYYSLLGETSGQIRINDKTYEVTGRSWMDHEYFTNDLGKDATGWDWFSAQFDNGQALMYGQIRLKDGGIREESHGTLVNSDFSTQHISADEIELSILDTWKSSETGTSYPIQWRIESPKHNLSLIATTMMPNCEMLLSANSYFECPTSYEGTINGIEVNGEGYMELTGYTP